MSRTVLHWAENTSIFKDLYMFLELHFKCDELEKIISEYYQRCFGEDLPSSINITLKVKIKRKNC